MTEQRRQHYLSRRGMICSVLAFALACLSMGTSAQQDPSENDLFAAYCTGALRAEIPVYRSRWLSDGSGTSDWLKNAMADGLVAMEARLAKTARYLAARGYGTSASTPSILFAISSGESDFAQCDQWRFSKNAQIHTECRAAHNDAQARVDQCFESQQPLTCKSIAKCGDVSRLPM